MKTSSKNRIIQFQLALIDIQMASHGADFKADSACDKPQASSLLLPFADAPSIVQAHQKDAQIETILSGKVQEVVKAVKGQLFINTHPLELSIAVKLVYLCLTTLKGSRTLGEEYVDLIYVGRRGNQLVQRYRKLLFIVFYCLSPYFFTRFLRRSRTNDDQKSRKNGFSFKGALSAVVNLHLILFYFNGAYYDVFKRIFGLRYALGHKVDENEAKFRNSSSNSYKFLGYILLVQGASKVVPAILGQLKSLTLPVSDSNRKAGLRKLQNGDKDAMVGIPEESRALHIDLSDESQLPYIPAASRSCILCLNLMTDPSSAPCGHVFCWSCILNWCKERPECPLCRQKCQSQQVLSLR